MPCALRQLRAACAQLRLSNYGSVRLRLRMEARGTLLRGSGGGHHSSGHLRRTSRDPSPTGDYSWTNGLNKSSLRFFVRSQGLTAAGTHVEDLLSDSRDESGWWLHLEQRGICGINGPLPPSCCRTQDTSRPPSRMARAATRTPYFHVDFDRTTGIFWDVPVKLGRGAAFWTMTSPPAGTPLKHDDAHCCERITAIWFGGGLKRGVH